MGGLLSHVSSLRLSAGNSGPVPYPKHATQASLSSPCSLVVETGVWATSPLGIAVRHVFCGFFFFFFPLHVILPSEIPNLLIDPLVRGFLAVWKFLILHDSLLRTGLCPKLFCLSFCLLYFVLPPLEENGLPFWVPGVLCQCSEVVLWKFCSAFE